MNRIQRKRPDRARVIRIVAATIGTAAASAARVAGVGTFGAAACIACTALGYPVWAVLPAYLGVSVGLDHSVSNVTVAAVTTLASIVICAAKLRRLWMAEIANVLVNFGSVYLLAHGESWVRWTAGVMLGALTVAAVFGTAGDARAREFGAACLAAIAAAGLHRIAELGAACFGIAAIVSVRADRRRATAVAVMCGAGASLALADPAYLAAYSIVVAAAAATGGSKWTAGIAEIAVTATAVLTIGLPFYPAIAAICGIFAGVWLPLPRRTAETNVRLTAPVVRKMQIAAEACRSAPLGTDGEDIDVAELAARLGVILCDGCKNYAVCRLDGSSMEDAVRRAVQKRRSGLDLLPDGVVEGCARAGDVPRVLNGLLKDYECNLALNELRGAATGLATEELHAFAELLTNFAEECECELYTDDETAREIAHELSGRGASLAGFACAGDGCLQLVAEGADEATVADAVSAVCGKNFAVDRITTLERGAEYALRPAPAFKLVYGVASRARQDVSGDCYIVRRINAGTVIAVLCDGMGTGAAARRIAERTVSVMESCFTAGFSTDSVMRLVNSMLSLSGGRFSCADILVVDLAEGAASFIKLGGVESLLVRGGEQRRIEGGALPLGVADLPVPAVTKVRLESGDVIVLVTDGVSDCGEIAFGDAANPQAVAEQIVNRAASSAPVADDMTALVLRTV